ncbi:MAG: hypothetical protein A4E74_00496 [Syntrophus sp. PtaB.Bin075]|nr:MAG: hypothetical protein A4E74_00496 [Syntrophus sp. PtaB.Bin075]
MKKLLLFVTAWSLFMLSACVMVPAHHGEGVVIAPALPAIVELTDPYYFYGDFHYYYHSDRWSYSKSKNGPWKDLPRDRYPRETRFKGGNGRDGRDDRDGMDDRNDRHDYYRR